MNTEIIQKNEDTFLIPTYKKMPLALVRGKGSYVWDADGKRYLDFYGGHCVTVLGHCPPKVVEAIQKQSERLLFYSNVVYSDVRAHAARALADMAPLQRIFFCNSGTEAIETALKIARKSTGRKSILSTRHGFHGRTLGSLAVTWNPSYREPFRDILPTPYFSDFGDITSMERILDDNRDIAAILLEPIQSIAGIVEASRDYFQSLRKICDQHGILLIFDEIQTGVGRTGTFSISEQLGVVPDMITLAKSLGSGIPVGALLCSESLARDIHHGDHGSTFGGGMVAMSAVAATLESIREQGLMEQAPKIFDAIAKALHPFALEIRGHGCLIGIRLDIPVHNLLVELRRQGVLAGGSADPNVMRLMPPLTTKLKHVSEFVHAFQMAMKQIHV